MIFFWKFMLFYLEDEQIQSAENRNFLFSEKINTRDFQKKNYLSLPCCDTYPAGCCWMYKSQSFIRHKNNNEKNFPQKSFFRMLLQIVPVRFSVNSISTVMVNLTRTNSLKDAWTIQTL